MAPGELSAIIAIVVCVLIGIILSLAQTVLASGGASRLEQLLGKSQESKSPSIDRLVEDPERIAAAVTIGITLVNLTIAAVTTGALTPVLGHVLEQDHVPHSFLVATIISVAAMCVLTLAVVQIAPRAVALKHPEKAAAAVAIPVRWIEFIERPVVLLVLAIGKLIVRPFGLKASFESPVITEDELIRLLETSQDDGVIEPEEKEMLSNVISFGDTVVREVMTPRIDIRSADNSATIVKLVNLIVDCGHSRIPIFEGSIDNIVGVVHAKDLLPALAAGQSARSVKSLMRQVDRIPEYNRVDELLKEFRRKKTQLAIVQDEYGGTAGLVTLEDLLEEIVGEIQDEYDKETPQFVRLADGSVDIDARAGIADVNDELDLSLSDEDFDTIGGFVFGLFGRMPQQGETIPYETIEFSIAQADGRRIRRLLVRTEQTKQPDDSDDASDESGRNVGAA